jgi:hypothetical protein
MKLAEKPQDWNYSAAVPRSIQVIGAMGATMRLPSEKQIKTTLKIQRIESTFVLREKSASVCINVICLCRGFCGLQRRTRLL